MSFPPSPPPVPVAPPDPAFLASLKRTVAVQRDANFTGTAADAHGDVGEDWQPVSGQQAVACTIYTRLPRSYDVGGRESSTMRWSVVTGHPYIWEQGYRLVFTDDDLGRARYGYVIGRTVNDKDGDIQWLTDCIEYVT